MAAKKLEYYEIFDYMRANKKVVIIASNKNYSGIVVSYFSRDTFIADRLSSRLEGLSIAEILTTRKSNFYAN